MGGQDVTLPLWFAYTLWDVCRALIYGGVLDHALSVHMVPSLGHVRLLLRVYAHQATLDW